MYPIPPNETLVETKTCRHCSASFPITDKDMEFYEKVSPVFPLDKGGARRAGDFLTDTNISQNPPNPLWQGGVRIEWDKIRYLIPTPTLCPECRRQRRLSWWNRQKIYRRKCDYSGKDIIAMYSPVVPFPVYDYEVWWSDVWDPLAYGQDFSFSEPVFVQIARLSRSVPRFSKSVFNSENSDYTNNVWEVRNCYLTFNCGISEDCYYCVWVNHSESVVDSLYVRECKQCYECMDCVDCTACFYSQWCELCSDSHFLVNCRGCQNCFGCTNLVNAQYAIFNEIYQKDEYHGKVRILLKDPFLRHKLDLFFLQSPFPATKSVHAESCSGDHIVHSHECVYSYVVANSEHARYADDVYDTKDIMDISSFGNHIYTSYESVIIGNNSAHLLFSSDSWDAVSELYYCQLCVQNCSNCFACIGLRNKQYCILNKQYTREEYEELVPRIIEHMMSTGEWGEFFPSTLSPFGYNETVAQEYYPLSRDVALQHLYNWSDYEPPFPKVEKIIPADKLPDDISKIPDDILNWAIECEVTKKPFRIIKQELEFYRKHNLPIPRRHPDQRHLDRMALRNPRKLFERKCDKCGKEMVTTYSPERKEVVYCEKCYEKEVIW